MPAGAHGPRLVERSAPIDAVLAVPGSKSLTNRALVLAAMASGRTELQWALRSDDTDALAHALGTLGATIEARGPGPGSDAAVGADEFLVDGVGGRSPAGGDVSLHLGDGGTPTRFAMAAAAFAPRRVTIDGSARMRERPMADGVALLRQLGVHVEWLERDGRLPVLVDGRAGPPVGGTLHVGRMASSQFASALLLLAPWMRDGLELRFDAPPTSASYLALTVDELRRWGAHVDEARDARGALRSIRVAPGPLAARGTVMVEQDASSAVFWAVAAAIVPGSDLVLGWLPPESRQPDMRVLAILESMGAGVVSGSGGVRVACRVSAGDASAPLDGAGDVDCGDCPDGALALMAAAAVAGGPTRITGLGTLRGKESDRLSAMQDALTRVGASVEVGTDWIEIRPLAAGRTVDARIDPHRDHRVAMSLAVLGMRTGGIWIDDPGCVSKSYPQFWTALDFLARGRAGAAHRAIE
ncbi:MAG: 3-phosphoshikimate 1-carboxyvinyltransferase [Phycisphaerales bacterium]